MHKTLIDPATLAQHLDDPSWVVIDCRFDLADPAKGEQLYREGHIPGARYAHLDRHLSGAKTGANGRHPLPTAEEMRSDSALSASGRARRSSSTTPTPACMRRDCGGCCVGWATTRWRCSTADSRDGCARVTSTQRRHRRARDFTGAPREDWRLAAERCRAAWQAGRLLVDARAEPVSGRRRDARPKAGHIPGARNYFFQQNLTADKTFKSPTNLRAQWLSLLDGTPPAQAVMYCGSGVTACHNLLALEHAGLHGARIFPGSWSEWSSDPSRPVTTGDL